MKFAIVGTGYVCDYYLTSLPYNPEVTLVGVYDRDQARSKIVADKYGVKQYSSLDELLADDEVVIVANLTNPRAHYEISKACLEADKHVYSEKPLADEPLEMMDFCRGITDLAEAITDGRPPRLSAEHALLITELTLAIQHPEAMGTPRVLESSFDPIEPMKWVRDATVNTDVGKLREWVKSRHHLVAGTRPDQ